MTAPARREPFVCLMYHNVTRAGESFADFSPSVTSYFVSESAFAEQMEVVRSEGRVMSPVTLERFYAHAQGNGERDVAARPVLLTFDDGWQGSVDVAGPVLERIGASAIVFVTTDFIGRPHFLTRQGLARVPAHIRVGSHAVTHRMLSRLDEQEIRTELEGSKKYLEDATGQPVEMLSIPGGAVDARVARLAGEVGYRYLFTSEVHANRPGGDAMGIGRVAIKRDTTAADVARYVRGNIARERVRRWVLAAPKRVIGLARYERLRRRLLGETTDQQVTHEP